MHKSPSNGDVTMSRPAVKVSTKHRSLLLAWCGVFLIQQQSVCAQPAEKRRLTVSDTIETVRIMSTAVRYSADSTGWTPRRIYVSPDARRYALMLVRGDVGRDGNWMELMSGELGSLAEAASIRRVAQFFTKAL